MVPKLSITDVTTSTNDIEITDFTKGVILRDSKVVDGESQ